MKTITTREFEMDGVTYIETTESTENSISVFQCVKPQPKKKWWENRNETLFFNRIREAIRILKGV